MRYNSCMNQLNSLYKRKKRRILVLSATSVHTGLQCLLLKAWDKEWHIIHSETILYTPKINERIQSIARNAHSTPVHLETLAQLDKEITLFLIESSQKFLSNLSLTRRRFDVIVFRKLSLWKGRVDQQTPPYDWNVSIGDAQFLADTFKKPVLTNFIRRTLIQGDPGSLPVLYGDINIAKNMAGAAVFVNIGLVSHITVVDSIHSKVVHDSDCGPGTVLIDRVAEEIGCEHGFDRDGSTALSGPVNTQVLETLLAEEWFHKPAPRHADSAFLETIYNHECLKQLHAQEKLTTLTAFTALAICNFYKKEIRTVQQPDAIWISGGGTYNRALIDFLQAYFNPIKIKDVNEIGIPPNNKISLSLGLSVQAYLNKQQIFSDSGQNLTDKPFGNWILPGKS